MRYKMFYRYENILGEYSDAMFGAHYGQYTVPQVSEYKHEFNEVLSQFQKMVKFGLEGDELEGCMVYLLHGILTDEKLIDFRYNGLRGLINQLFDVMIEEA